MRGGIEDDRGCGIMREERESVGLGVNFYVWFGQSPTNTHTHTHTHTLSLTQQEELPPLPLNIHGRLATMTGGSSEEHVGETEGGRGGGIRAEGVRDDGN